MPQSPQDLRHLNFAANVHPTLTLCLWLFVVLLTQRLPVAWMLPVLLVALLYCRPMVRAQWWLLMRRSRWLLVVLALTFLLMTPGERLPAWIPGTAEGALQATEHLLRLIVVLFAVAWLVGGHSIESLQAGLWGIADLLGSDAMKRAVARLVLTLRYSVDSRASLKSGPAWKSLIDDLSHAADHGPVEYSSLAVMPVPVGQAIIAVAAGLATGMIWWGLS